MSIYQPNPLETLRCPEFHVRCVGKFSSAGRLTHSKLAPGGIATGWRKPMLSAFKSCAFVVLARKVGLPPCKIATVKRSNTSRTVPSHFPRLDCRVASRSLGDADPPFEAVLTSPSAVGQRRQGSSTTPYRASPKTRHLFINRSLFPAEHASV